MLSNSPQQLRTRGSLSDRYTLSHAVDEWSNRVLSDKVHGSVLQVALPSSERADGLLVSSGTDGLLRLWSTVTRGREPELVELGAVPNIKAFSEDEGRASDSARVRPGLAGGAERATSTSCSAALLSRAEAMAQCKGSAVNGSVAGGGSAGSGGEQGAIPSASSGAFAYAHGIAARALAFSPLDDKLFSADIAGNLLRWDVAALLDSMHAQRAAVRTAEQKSDVALAPLSTVAPEEHVAVAHGRSRNGRVLAALTLVLHVGGWGADALGCGGDGSSAVLISAGELPDVAIGDSAAEAELMSAAASSSSGSPLRFWTTSLKRVHATVEPPLSGTLHSMAFAKDGTTFVAAGPGRSSDISLWEVSFVSRSAAANGGNGSAGGGGSGGSGCGGGSGGIGSMFRGYGAGGVSASRSSDSLLPGTRLVFVMSAHRVCINAHGGAPVRSIATSPDDSRIISAGADGHLRLWIVRASTSNDGDGKRSVGLVALGDAIGGNHCQLAVNACAFTPSGSHLVTGGADGALRTWPAEWCLRTEGNIHRFDPPLLSSVGSADTDSGVSTESGRVGSGSTPGTPGAGARRPPQSVCESLFLGEDPGFGYQANVPPRISRAALELAFGRNVVHRWLEESGIVFEEDNASIGAGSDHTADADDQAVEQFRRAHVSDQFWLEMTLMWPVRLAANAHSLVLKAVASANHEALRQLLRVNAACDWGHPFAILHMRAGDSPSGGSYEISALHLAIARADSESVKLLLRYMVKLKKKAHSLSTVLHVTDLLLLLDRFPFMLSQFLDLLGLEAVHPAISESCRRAAVMEGNAWNRRMLRSAVPYLDAFFEFAGWRARVPAGGFITRSRAERDPPDVWHDMAVLSEQQATSVPTVALRLGVKDALACRDILPLIVYSRAASSLLQTPAAIALIDAKWHAYACRWFLTETVVLQLYIMMNLLFLLLSPFDEVDDLSVFGSVIHLHHISSIVGFAAKLIIVINSMFVVREVLVWRLTARATGTAKSYLFDVWNFFDWALILSSTCASCVYLRCAGWQPTPHELLLGISPDARSRCQNHHGSSTSDWVGSRPYSQPPYTKIAAQACEHHWAFWTTNTCLFGIGHLLPVHSLHFSHHIAVLSAAPHACMRLATSVAGRIRDGDVGFPGARHISCSSGHGRNCQHGHARLHRAVPFPDRDVDRHPLVWARALRPPERSLTPVVGGRFRRAPM